MLIRPDNQNYFIWQGVNSKTYGITCTNPPIYTPTLNAKKITVPGRSGFYLSSEDSYAPVVKSIDCRISDTQDISSALIDAVTSWLTGAGRVIFSIEKDKYYNAYLISQVPIEFMLKNYGAFPLTFDCQPFKYSVDAENHSLVFTSPATFYGKGTYRAAPVITVYGSGNINLIINNKTISLTSISEYITINSDIMDAYKGTQSLNQRMSGEFPFLVPGQNTINWTGNVNKIEITPNYRWI